MKDDELFEVTFQNGMEQHTRSAKAAAADFGLAIIGRVDSSDSGREEVGLEKEQNNRLDLFHLLFNKCSTDL